MSLHVTAKPRTPEEVEEPWRHGTGRLEAGGGEMVDALDIPRLGP